MKPKEFLSKSNNEIMCQGRDHSMVAAARNLHKSLGTYNYFHHFSWAGLPVIQAPQDIMQLQELVWVIKPDLIIETGIARGGSLVFYSSLLELNASCGGPQDAEVLGIDIDIRPYTRKAIEVHPLVKRISMIQGSSIAPEIIEQVKAKAAGKQRVLVCLDSNHTHDHVLAELHAYAPLTSVDSYCVVFDTVIEDLPENLYEDRPWGPGNNPKTAVREYLKTHSEFEIDKKIDYKLMITAAPDGWLKRMS